MNRQKEHKVKTNRLKAEEKTADGVDPEYLNMDLLRFTTAGSVDDGKSTLIGRLLYDSKSIFEDQWESLESTTKNRGEGQVNLALLTDGLRAEREQGITIDVAYRYFATPRRKFIIADTPGHEQYTRNMVTGASTADLAIILIDARKGVLTQSRRHAFLSSLLQIPHLVVAVNKMDLVDYSEERFREIVDEFKSFSENLEVADITFIPISALKGDNIVKGTDAMPWYRGATLLHHLEHVNVGSRKNAFDFRFPVQYVIRPDQDFRGYAGRVVSGGIRNGEEVTILPTRKHTRIIGVETPAGPAEEAKTGESVVLRTEHDIDISRGDMIVRRNNVPNVKTVFEATLSWMGNDSLQPDKAYLLMHTSRSTRAVIKKVRYRINVDSLHREQTEELNLNEIGRVIIETAEPLFFDAYKLNNVTGSFIVIDPDTNVTVGAGMIRSTSTTAPTEENNQADTDEAPKQESSSDGQKSTGGSDVQKSSSDGQKSTGGSDVQKSSSDGQKSTGGSDVQKSSSNEPVQALSPEIPEKNDVTEKPVQTKSPDVIWEPWNIPREEREARNQHKAHVIWFTGASGAGKTTIARALETGLWKKGMQTMLLDGDQVRHGLNRDLGFSPTDRKENIRRVGEVARLFFEHGNIVICSFVSPYREDRKLVSELFPDGFFTEIYLHCAAETLQKRDPKGLYKKAKAGKIRSLTGFDAEHEGPCDHHTLTIDTDTASVEQAVNYILTSLK